MTPTAKRQLALQTGAALAVLAFAWPYYAFTNQALPWQTVSLGIGVAAFLLASVFRQPWWWRLLHGIFAPCAWWVAGMEIEPLWFLSGFMLLLVLFRGAVTEQVPLYLTSEGTARLLADLLPATTPFTFADLGAGVGTALGKLAPALPQGKFIGVENAPLSWMLGKLRFLNEPQVDWRWGSFWEFDLSGVDVAYAFLSPAPMEALWDKACGEMRPGTLFISNSFPVPDVTPDTIVGDEASGARPLYVYRIPQPA